MTRALTLADVLRQLNDDSATQIDLSNTEVINVFYSDNEGAIATETVKNFDTLTPYDVTIIQDASPVGYWRLNEYANLLSTEDQTFEGGTTGTWSPSNATIANSNAQHHTGTKSLQITSSAAGNVDIGCAGTGTFNRGQPVVPGQAYVFNYWIYNTSAAKNFDAQITWRRNDGSVVAISSLSLVSATQNTWVQATATYTAPASSAFGEVDVHTTAGAGGEVYYLDDVFFLQVGYDSNALSNLAGFTKSNAQNGTSPVLPGQSGPYSYPNGSFLSGSMLFPQTTSGLNVTSTTQLQITTDVTLEAWICPTIALSGNAQYGVVGKGGVAGEYAMFINGNGSLWYSDSTLGSVAVANPGSLAGTNQWSHIVITRKYSNRSITGYINGVKQLTVTYASAPATTSSNLQIGANSAFNTVAGLKIGEVAVYQRALTASQVLNHYNWGGAPGGTPPTGQKTTGSGWGFSFNDTGTNTGKYGQYGFFQYAAGPTPSVAQYNAGSVWDSFFWQQSTLSFAPWGGGVWGGMTWS